MHSEWIDFFVNERMESVHFSSLNLGMKDRNPIIGTHGYYDSVELGDEWRRKYGTEAPRSQYRHKDFRFSGKEDLRLEGLWRGRRLGIEFIDNYSDIFGDYQTTNHLIFPACPKNLGEIEQYPDKNSFYFTHYASFLARGMAYYLKMFPTISTVKIIQPHAYNNPPIRRAPRRPRHDKIRDLRTRPLLLNQHLINQISEADVIHIVDDTILYGDTIGRIISDIFRMLEKSTNQNRPQICVHTWFSWSEGTQQKIKAIDMKTTFNHSLSSPEMEMKHISEYYINVSDRLLPRYIEESIRYLEYNQRFRWELHKLNLFEDKPPWKHPELYKDELSAQDYEIIDYGNDLPYNDEDEDSL
jgi:hypothetical protein